MIQDTPVYRALVSVISMLRDYPQDCKEMAADELAKLRVSMKGPLRALNKHAIGSRDVFADVFYLEPLIEHFGPLMSLGEDGIGLAYHVDEVLRGLIDDAEEAASISLGVPRKNLSSADGDFFDSLAKLHARLRTHLGPRRIFRGARGAPTTPSSSTTPELGEQDWRRALEL